MHVQHVGSRLLVAQALFVTQGNCLCWRANTSYYIASHTPWWHICSCTYGYYRLGKDYCHSVGLILLQVQVPIKKRVNLKYWLRVGMRQCKRSMFSLISCWTMMMFSIQNICLRYIGTNDWIVIAMSHLTWEHLEEMMMIEVGVSFATSFIIGKWIFLDCLKPVTWSMVSNVWLNL